LNGGKILEKLGFFDGIEEKRRKICEAAVKLFTEKKYDKTTVAEIAKEAKVGKGTFYLYFNSKVDLLNFLLRHGIEKLIAYVKNEIESELDPINKLKKAMSAQLCFFNRYRDYFAFLISELWSYRKCLQNEVKSIQDRYIVIFEEIMKDGIEKGVYKDINTSTMSSGIFGMLSLSFLYSPEKDISIIIEDVHEVLISGLSKKGE